MMLYSHTFFREDKKESIEAVLAEIPKCEYLTNDTGKGKDPSGIIQRLTRYKKMHASSRLVADSLTETGNLN